jgi:hypothetical protein
MSERERAFRAAQGAYAVRVCGMSVPCPIYDGPFDIMAVVNAAPIPSTPDLQMHRACWAEFRRMFEQAWEER